MAEQCLKFDSALSPPTLSNHPLTTAQPSSSCSPLVLHPCSSSRVSHTTRAQETARRQQISSGGTTAALRLPSTSALRSPDNMAAFAQPRWAYPLYNLNDYTAFVLPSDPASTPTDDVTALSEDVDAMRLYNKSKLILRDVSASKSTCSAMPPMVPLCSPDFQTTPRSNTIHHKISSPRFTSAHTSTNTSGHTSMSCTQRTQSGLTPPLLYRPRRSRRSAPRSRCSQVQPHRHEKPTHMPSTGTGLSAQRTATARPSPRTTWPTHQRAHRGWSQSPRSSPLQRRNRSRSSRRLTYPEWTVQRAQGTSGLRVERV